MCSRNPFDDDDDDLHLYDRCQVLDQSIITPKPATIPSRQYVANGSFKSGRPDIGNAPTNVRQPSRKASMKKGMKSYVSNNKVQFQAIFEQASNQLVSEGGGSSVVDYTNDSDDVITKFLWNERVYGFPHSGGTLLGNYKGYVFNNHPLMSIFLAHKLNPFDKIKRMIVYFCLLCFTLFTSFILLETMYFKDLALCRDGCDHSLVMGNDGNQVDVCSGGRNDGMPFEQWNAKCKYYHPMFLSALCGAVVVPYGMLLKYLATCGCIMGKRFMRESCIGRQLSRCTDCFGWGFLILFSFIGIVSVGWTIFECWRVGVGFEIFVTLLLSKVWSFFEWFVYSAPYFAYLYPKDRRYFYQRQRRKQGLSSSSPLRSDIEVGIDNRSESPS